MKVSKLLVVGCLVLVLLACSHLSATKEKSPCSRNGWWKYVELEVLKVYSALDGDAIYRSYLVKWKDQEVVVTDTLVRTEYKEGDKITVVAMAHSYPNGDEDYGLLSFEVAPPEVVEKLTKKDFEQ